MSNLLTSLTSAASAMSTYEKAMEVVQNDTVNVNTPGYVRQSVGFQSLPFDLNSAQSGGVGISGVLSSRDEYAEHNVQQQQTAYGMSSTTVSYLSSLQSLFDLQSTTGIAGSLNSLFSSFSQLTVSPNDAQSRQSVINAGSRLATAFNVAANGLAAAGTAVDSATQNIVKDLNNTIADIQQLNVELRKQAQTTSPDPSLDARLHVDLEKLSQYAGITSVRSQDESISVYLGDQTALVVGTTQYPISVAGSGPSTIIKDSNGNDVTASVSGGQLGALLKIRNTTLPGYQSQLDTMAQKIVSAVNNQLAAGKDKNGIAGTPLFTGATASTISVNAAITADKIAAASATNPGGNDNALQLSALQNSTAVGLGTFTFTQYIGDLSSTVGRDISNATDDQTTQQQLLAQAQTLRAQSSSVSLDEEAARLVEYQRAYQATSKLISVIDNLTQTLLGLIPSAG